MNKEWVLERQNKTRKEIKKKYEEIRAALESLQIFDDNDIEEFILNIIKSVRMGFDSHIFMFPQKVYNKYKDFYTKVHNKEKTALSFSAFYQKVDDVLKQIDFKKLVVLERTDYERYQDSEPVYFDGDIIITDPCYVLNPDDWTGDEENLESIGIKNSMVRDTLCGDWRCATFNLDTKEIIGEFCADGGMVAVLSLEEVLNYNPTFDYHKSRKWTTTLIENFKGEVQFVVKEEKWTLDEDTSYGKRGDEITDYAVEVVGKGINTKTGEPINFVGKQTGF